MAAETGFCGDSVLWDLQVTWNNTWPEFTDCFQNTVLSLVPCAWLWIISPVFIWHLLSETRMHIPVSGLHIAKIVFTLLLGMICVAEAVKAIVTHNQDSVTSFQADVVSPFIRTCTLLYAAFLMHYQRRKGAVTSALLFVFWGLQVIAGIIPFYSNIIKQEYDTDVFGFVLYLFDFAFVMVLFLMNCFAELPRIDKSAKTDGNKEILASTLSQLMFSWMTGLIYLGYKRPLEEKDIYQQHPKDRSEAVIPRFQAHWTESTIYVDKRTNKKDDTETKSLYQSINSSGSRDKSPYGEANEKTPLLQPDSRITKKADPVHDTVSGEKVAKRDVSITRTILKTFWWELAKAQFFELLHVLIMFMFPLLQNALISFTSDMNMEMWKGYVLAAAFFLVSIAQTIVHAQSLYRNERAGMRIRTALIAAVYDKALHISPTARKDSSVGQIVNLMAIDTNNVLELLQYSYVLWSGPLQLAISLVMLYNLLGPSIFAGFGGILVMIPINLILFMKFETIQTKQMGAKDARLKLMHEILNGIKVLKLYAWEPPFEQKVMEVRKTELKSIRKIYILFGIVLFLWTLAPYIFTLVTFTVYILTSKDHVLDANAFVAISLFAILQEAITAIPEVFSSLAKVKVSIKRINTYLSHGDISPENVTQSSDPDTPMVMKNATFQWDSNLGPCLKNINISIPKGKLTAIVGQVGCGKSSLISAILGEMEKLSGTVTVNGSFAYVPQEAWIQNMTLKDNVLFEKDFDQTYYNDVLDGCALLPDIQILPGGDMTEIGEKGINLSGGQKQRVSLARAVYSDRDIFLLDDPLSAVDAHVGKHIFENILSANGLLKEKTRVLVTHRVQWLPEVDHIIVLSDGTVSDEGNYESLMSHDGSFAQILRTYLTENADDGDESVTNDIDDEAKEIKTRMLERLISITDDTPPNVSRENSVSDADAKPKKSLRRRSRAKSEAKLVRSLSRQQSRAHDGTGHMSDMLIRSLSKSDNKENASFKQQKSMERLIEEEKSAVGHVKFSVYGRFLKAVGCLGVVFIVLAFALYEGAMVGSNVWLQHWTDDPMLQNMSLPANSSERSDKNNLYLGIYGLFGALQACCMMAFLIVLAYRMYHASLILHQGMLSNILKCPMSFFDTTPVGRIMNRFSKDTDTVDEELPNLFVMWFMPIFGLIGTIVVIGYATPIFLVIVIPLVIVYYFIQKFYVGSARQLRRMGAKSDSPIFAHFTETLNGASVIRAYGQQDRFRIESCQRVDTNQHLYILRQAAVSWLSVCLDLLGGLAILAAALLAVAEKGTMTGGIMGLSITYAMQVTGQLSLIVISVSNLEIAIVSVERIHEYTMETTEAPRHIPESTPPFDWPAKGEIQFTDYTTRYRAGLDLVLRGINVTIKPGEKVGIAGRTGAGKSSITLALFRIIEAAGGSIQVDNMDIKSVGLHNLRKRLTILPQEPVLFSGSLRMNLDPLDLYTDAELWAVLEHAHLKSFIEGLPDQLQHECGEGGENLSVGQRQLVCLARSLLRKTKILVLDEATAAVDMETDELIQQTIRSEFKDCTILSIAHRLNTIMDYDRILVLSNGLVSEYDSPSNLLQNKDSDFYSMAKEAGLVS